MYIETVEITNIKSIKKFKLNFKDPAGWHVLIGDNGAGKSSMIKSIALALVGPDQAKGLRADWNEWLSNDSEKGGIVLYIDPHDEFDKRTGRGTTVKKYYIRNTLNFNRKDDFVFLTSNANPPKGQINPLNLNWGNGDGWFSVAYGPFRRFGGGNRNDSKLFYSMPKLGAHLSAFGDDFALTEVIEWLVNLQYQNLEKKHTGNIIADFLPHNTILDTISSEGVIFKDGNNNIIDVTQMSDGYRSILSLTFELIRQLVRVYGPNEPFKEVRKGNMKINLPGVVLIDEVDAHLHPTWQTRIGQWFTKYFPQIQFIVTTHSPLVCRACENGTIWRLAAPGSENKSGEVKANEREKLINGNILDAYGTEIFGKTPVRSEKSSEKLTLLGKLNMLSALGKISEKEEKQRINLQQILTTDDPTGL